MAITAEAIVELFEKDVRARKRLAELLVSEPDIRLAIINAVLRDVATKSDIERIRGEFDKIRSEYATKEDIKILGSEIEKIRGEYATKEDVKILRDEIEKIRADLVDVRERLSKLEGIVSQLVERMNDFDKRIDALDKRIDSLDKRLDYVAKISWTLTAGVIATLIVNIVILVITHWILR
ncbi:conserved hypothetical protein [Ignisphaera aggregans DSM 17230]|uniref:DUF1640 domain-containing protein n=1 Tax=Ignisphaera aggregans (strain DSM 17230 / JCM 13409 / AQ1.S1) TaxID=583356 RepID=E0SSY1_IGNAA|nr:conserved hypothetical protein [Ignisphaera aggregans DSM 17230]